MPPPCAITMTLPARNRSGQLSDRVTLDDNGEKVEIVLGADGMLRMPGEASRAAHVEGR